MLTTRFTFATVALAIGSAVAFGCQPTTAGKYHHRRDIAHAISERVRNAQAYSAPVARAAPEARYFDEALSPPAGQ
jgi:hypothetical protein